MNEGNINNSYSRGNVFGNQYVGGFVGIHGYYDNTIALSNCYSTGSVSGIFRIGGFVGYKNNSSTIVIVNSYWDTETSGLGTSAGGTGYVTSAMIKATNSVPIYEGWDFDTIWNIDEGTSYPYLRNNKQIPHPVPIID